MSVFILPGLTDWHFVTVLLCSGPDTLHCLRGETMLLQSTVSSASLTIFSPNWLAAHSTEVSCTNANERKIILHSVSCLTAQYSTVRYVCIYWIFNRGRQNSQLITGATVGAAVPKLAERRVRVKVLAAELPSLPAWGGSRCRNAEKSFTPAAVDHTGESWFIVCLLSNTNKKAQGCQNKLPTPRLHAWIPPQGAQPANNAAVRGSGFLSASYSELPASTCNSVEFCQLWLCESVTMTPYLVWGLVIRCN